MAAVEPEPSRGLTADERQRLKSAISDARRENLPSVVSGKRRALLDTAELATLRLTAEGMSAREIALARGTTLYGTEAVRRRLLHKLGAVNAAHAVALGFRRGLLE